MTLERECDVEISYKVDKLDQFEGGLKDLKYIHQVLRESYGAPITYRRVLKDKTLVFEGIDATFLKAVNGGLSGVYDEAVSEGMRNAVNNILQKHKEGR